jgi:hypothetical protein
MPIILALGRLRHGEFEFGVSLGYIMKLCLKKTKQKPNK